MHSDAYNEQLKKQRVGVCSHTYVLTVNILPTCRYYINTPKLSYKCFLIASYITQVADLNVFDIELEIWKNTCL